MVSFEQQVRERAYHIWIAGGMGDGMAHEHWVYAERAIQSEQARPKAEASTKKASAKKTSTVAVKKASPKAASNAMPVAGKAAAKSRSNAKDARVSMSTH